MSLTAEFLLQGAFFALERAGQLLQDAKLLYDHERYASSFALAVLSREETGRSAICVEKCRLTLNGQTVTVELLRSETKPHVAKILASQELVGVPVSITWWGENPTPGSPEEKDLVARLEKKRKLLEEHLPKEAHQRKLQALYVDPAEDAPYWSRPALEIRRSEAELMLSSANLEYDKQRARLLIPADSQLKSAFDNFRSHPPLLDIDLDLWGPCVRSPVEE